MASAGPEQGHGPSAAVIRAISAGGPMAKPSRRPARPKNLPNERRMRTGQIAAQCDRAARRIEIGERLVDHQPAAACPDPRGQARKFVLTEQASIGIVGIDHHNVAYMIGKLIETGEGKDFVATALPGGGMFAVGRTDDGDRARSGEIWQPLDQRLAARSCSDIDAHQARRRLHGPRRAAPAGRPARAVVARLPRAGRKPARARD